MGAARGVLGHPEQDGSNSTPISRLQPRFRVLGTLCTSTAISCSGQLRSAEMNWPYLVSAFCGLILAALVLALIFRPAFRRDLVAGEGRANVLGVLSVEGVIIVLLIAIFFAGLLWPVVKSPSMPRCPDDLEAGIRVIRQHIAREVDPDLRELSASTLDDWEEMLLQLDRGTLTLKRQFAGAPLAIEKIRSMKKGDTVLATHVAHRNLQDLYAWEDQRLLREYFAENVSAVARGVRIRRVFIVQKQYLYDENGECVTSHRAIDLLKHHEDEGIDVYVTWLEDVPNRTHVEDFIVFDDSLLQVNDTHVDESYYKVTLVAVPERIEKYRRRWVLLSDLGSSFAEMTEEFRKDEAEVEYCD